MAARALTPRLRRRASRERGQSLVEFIIVVPVFLFLLLGILQAALLFRAKSTLDYAALEAARAGATGHAEPAPIRRGLQRGLAPLFATEPSAAGLADAMARAGADIDGHACIEVINPTRAAFQQHSEAGYAGLAIPNDSLSFRPTTVDPRLGRGVRPSRVNLQDANLLKVRIVYRYPLVVPFVDRVLGGASNLVRGGADAPLSRQPGDRHFRLPLESHAIVRMQSPVTLAALPGLLDCPDCPRRCDDW